MTRITPALNWLPSGRRHPTFRARPDTSRKVLSARSAPNASIAPATRPARFGFARRSNARCGHSGQVEHPWWGEGEKTCQTLADSDRQTAFQDEGSDTVQLSDADRVLT